MPPLKGGSPFATQETLMLGGERFFVAADPKTGARAWKSEYVPAQSAKWSPEAAIDLPTFSQGYGFTWEGLPGTYSHADGWDASTPGKLTTWPALALGESFTTTDAKGWMFQLGSYLYVARGRYVKKYQITDTPGVTWPVVDTHDLGSGNICTGRPGIFGEKAYVPVRQGSSGPLQVFHQLATVAAAPTADTWNTGPVGYEMQCFISWQNKMYGASGNAIYSVSADPLTGTNWAPSSGNGNEVGDPSRDITDLALYLNLLVVAKTDGLYTFDSSFQVVNELPDLRFVVDSQNGAGMEYAGGFVLVPHRSGLYRWAPGQFAAVGPDQEGAMESALSDGWGRVSGLVPFGGTAFAAVNDDTAQEGALISLQPATAPQSRGPLVPHVHQLTDGAYDAVGIASLYTLPIRESALTTWATDTAVGDHGWSNPGNVAADDGTYAISGSGTTYYLKGTQLARPTVPAGATITGVTATVTRKAAGA